MHAFTERTVHTGTVWASLAGAASNSLALALTCIRVMITNRIR